MPDRSPRMGIGIPRDLSTEELVRMALEDGNPCVDDDGNCLDCGVSCELVAEGAAQGCEVCIAFIKWTDPS